MWKKILIALVVLLVLLVVVGALLPRDYEVSRQIVIDAKPSKIHDWVADMRRWDDWMPWKEEDPTIKVTLGKRHTGEGATQTWTGKEGEGQIAITKSDKETGIEFDMSFDQGRLLSKSSVVYEKVGKATRVTWNMTGEWPMPVVGGYMAMLIEMQAGPMFEKGLQNLKRVVEAD